MSGIRKPIKTAIVTVNIQKTPFAKKIFIVFLLTGLLCLTFTAMAQPGDLLEDPNALTEGGGILQIPEAEGQSHGSASLRVWT